MLLLAAFTPSCQQGDSQVRSLAGHHDKQTFLAMTTRSNLIVVKLHALSLQPAGADRAEAETTGQELQPDGGEQGGGLKGGAGPVCTPGLAALLLHAGDQHHNLMERLQPQLEGQNIRFYENVC